MVKDGLINGFPEFSMSHPKNFIINVIIIARATFGATYF